MPVRTRSSLWLGILIAFAGSVSAATTIRLDPDPGWRNAGSLAELAEVLDTWLDGRTDLRRPARVPAIRIVAPDTAAAVRGMAGSGHGRTRGLFDPETSTIYLVYPWDRRSPHDASVLLHELVHARQGAGHYYCPGAKEADAYRLQDAWLRERGLRAKVNWIAVVLETGCTRRDIHPD